MFCVSWGVGWVFFFFYGEGLVFILLSGQPPNQFYLLFYKTGLADDLGKLRLWW